MSNARAIETMHAVLDAFEAGQVSARDVKKLIGESLKELRDLPREVLAESKTLTKRLAAADERDGIDAFGDGAPVALALAELRTLLRRVS